MNFKNMYLEYAYQIVRAVAGCIICAFGTVLVLRGNLGLNPWTILNQGVAVRTGLSLGQAGKQFTNTLQDSCLSFYILGGCLLHKNVIIPQ